MILQSLDALYDRLENDPDYAIAPPGYSRQKVTFKVVLRPDGSLVDIQDARVLTEGARRPRSVRVLGETKPSGAALNPCLLWDNSAYLLGFKVEDENPGRTRKSFEALRKRHLDLRDSIPSESFRAVCEFLGSWEPGRAKEFPVLEDAAKTGFGVFQIQGESSWVHEDARIDQWWQSSLGDQGEAPEGQCLVTGKLGRLARLHEKIKGIAGGQGAGAPLVGFNADAFESFGREQSFNAPVSENAAFRYCSALNALLDGSASVREKHRLTLGDMTVAFWTDRPSDVEDVFAPFLAEGSAAMLANGGQDEGLRKKLESFLTALREGREAYATMSKGAPSTNYYVLGLSPNAGRVAVRFFHRATLGDLVDNLHRHHADIGQAPQPAAGKRPADPEFPPTWLLLRQTARESKEISPLLAGPLLRSVLTGSDYPQGLFTAIVRRIRADRTIDYPRACALKGYLNRNLKREVPMSLDPARPDPAYRLGRLFAALEKTQKDALGENLNKTIRDSFYSSASATPGTVFPRLMRTYQHHLAKLEGGRRVNREKLVQEIFEPLSELPSHFNLADQGLFAVGYYHQVRDFYTKHASTTES